MYLIWRKNAKLRILGLLLYNSLHY